MNCYKCLVLPFTCELDAILDECKHIPSLFPNFRVEFARKQSNEVAYVLTRRAIPNASLVIYQHVSTMYLLLISNEILLSKKKKALLVKKMYNLY